MRNVISYLVNLQDWSLLFVRVFRPRRRNEPCPALAFELDDNRRDGGVGGSAQKHAASNGVEIGVVRRRLVKEDGDEHDGGEPKAGGAMTLYGPRSKGDGIYRSAPTCCLLMTRRRADGL